MNEEKKLIDRESINLLNEIKEKAKNIKNLEKKHTFLLHEKSEYIDNKNYDGDHILFCENCVDTFRPECGGEDLVVVTLTNWIIAVEQNMLSMNRGKKQNIINKPIIELSDIEEKTLYTRDNVAFILKVTKRTVEKYISVGIKGENGIMVLLIAEPMENGESRIKGSNLKKFINAVKYKLFFPDN